MSVGGGLAPTRIARTRELKLPHFWEAHPGHVVSSQLLPLSALATLNIATPTQLRALLSHGEWLASF